MSASLYLCKYNEDAYSVLERMEVLLDHSFDEHNHEIPEKYEEYNKLYEQNRNLTTFDKHYRLSILRHHKSKTMKTFMIKWNHRFVKHWSKNEHIVPIEIVSYHSSRSIKLRRKWFEREAWCHVITTKSGLYGFMKRYVEKESHDTFVKDIIHPFIEGETFLDVSY